MTDVASIPTPAESRPEPDGEGVTCVVFREGQVSKAPHDLNNISEVLREQDALVWFDAVDPKQEDLKLIEEEFNLHPLAVEDAIQAHERPKIEAYPTYWFVIVLATTMSEGELQLHEMAIFAGQKFLVTVRHDPAFSIEEIRDRWVAHPDRICHGGGYLLYSILDNVVDGYLPVAEQFQERVDDLEEMLFTTNRVNKDVMPEIFHMKKDAQRFRHAVLPMRDILNPIIRGDIKLFDEHEIPYFRDVYDHTVLVIDQLDTMRDLVNSALEIHLSVIANRQNEVAKQLTIIATIFLPLSFIVGFFGQNFSFLVANIGGTGKFWFLGMGTELLAVCLTIGYFKWKRWF
jgi:magnesium transporter